MNKHFITTDLAGDLEVLFPQRDLYYGQDGNLYSESQRDYASPLAYVNVIKKDEDGEPIEYEINVNEDWESTF